MRGRMVRCTGLGRAGRGCTELVRVAGAAEALCDTCAAARRRAQTEPPPIAWASDVAPVVGEGEHAALVRAMFATAPLASRQLGDPPLVQSLVTSGLLAPVDGALFEITTEGVEAASRANLLRGMPAIDS